MFPNFYWGLYDVADLFAFFTKFKMVENLFDLLDLVRLEETNLAVFVSRLRDERLRPPELSLTARYSAPFRIFCDWVLYPTCQVA